MIETCIEKMASPIGYDIGNSNDVVQAELINGLSRALCNSMQDHQLELQCCYIVDKLDDRSLKLIEILNGFVILKNKK